MKHRLFRESCTFNQGIYVKDLSRLGRPLRKCLIIDNSPYSYSFQPKHALPCSSWFDEKTDNELLNILELLKIIDKSGDDITISLEKINL